MTKKSMMDPTTEDQILALQEYEQMLDDRKRRHTRTAQRTRRIRQILQELTMRRQEHEPNELAMQTRQLEDLVILRHQDLASARRQLEELRSTRREYELAMQTRRHELAIQTRRHELAIQTLRHELAIQTRQPEELRSTRRQYELAMQRQEHEAHELAIQSHQETARDSGGLVHLLPFGEIRPLENDAADQHLRAASVIIRIPNDHYRRPPASGPHPTATTNTEEPRSCIVCEKDVSAAVAIPVPCKHHYCRGCMIQSIEKWLSDEIQNAPRCCGSRIKLEDVADKVFFSPDLVKRYRDKLPVNETHDETYCHDPACGKFIPPEEIKGRMATCIWCECATCDRCKKDFHEGICPVDEDAEETLRMANEQGWKRCPACKTVVERREGCPHITCHCGKEFCYVCLEDWDESAGCPCT